MRCWAAYTRAMPDVVVDSRKLHRVRGLAQVVAALYVAHGLQRVVGRAVGCGQGEEGQGGRTCLDEEEVDVRLFCHQLLVLCVGCGWA